jgi:hypothetical protein
MLFTLLLVGFLTTRLIPYLWSQVPLGYDPGLYLYLFKKYSEIPMLSFANLPAWLIQAFQPGIPIIARITTIFVNPEKILLPLIVASQIFLFISVYLLAKKFWDKKTALWTVFLFTCSAVQYRLYWYYYLKNITALSFLILAFYFLSLGSYWSILFSVLVLYFHQQTGAFLLAVLFALFIFQPKKRRFYLTVSVATLIVAAPYYLPTFNQTLYPFIRPVVISLVPPLLGGTLGTPSGSFYNLPAAIILALPYLGFALWGLKLLRSKKEFPFIIIPIAISFPIALFGLSLSRRFIPFLDLFLLFPAGYAACWYFNKKKRFALIYILFVITLIGIYVYKTGRPLIVDDEFKEISMLSQTEPNAYVLVTDQEYTPWVYGWSERKPITPGFGENDICWTTDQWHEFWQNDNPDLVRSLLLKLPQPLYIYHGDRHWAMNFYPEGECFERVNWRTWKFVCDK